MQKTMVPQKPVNFLGPGPEVLERRRVAKEQAAQRVRSQTVQNEMGGVLRWVFASPARRILDSAKPREIELNRRLCPLQQKRKSRAVES